MDRDLLPQERAHLKPVESVQPPGTNSKVAPSTRLMFALNKADCAAMGLNSSQKQVLESLVGRWNPKRHGSLVWPGIEIMAKQTGLNEKSVRRNLQALKELNLIAIHPRRGGQRGKNRGGGRNEYSLNTDLMFALAVPAQCSKSDTDDPPDKQRSTGHSVRMNEASTGHGVHLNGCSTGHGVPSTGHGVRLMTKGMTSTQNNDQFGHSYTGEPKIQGSLRLLGDIVGNGQMVKPDES